MTDLVRPVGGQSLFDSDGAGTLSTTMLHSYADLIETNEDALVARTSPNIVTTDQYSDIAAVVLNTAEVTTGWYAIQNDTAGTNPGPSTSTTASEGTNSIQANLKGASGDLTASLYVNLTEVGYASGLDVAPGQNIMVDYLLASTVAESPSTNAFTRFAVTLASGVDMTGTLISKTFSQADVTSHELNVWYTVIVPVSSLTNIRSIGLKKVLSGGSGANRSRWHLDNIRLASTTPIDQAYHAQGGVSVVVPPDYVTTSTQLPIEAAPTRSILDLRPEKIHGGVRWLDDYQLDTTGATDITHDLQVVLDSLADGETLVGSPHHLYLMNGSLDFNVDGVTFDFNGAKLFQNERGTERICILRAARVTLKNGHIFGYTASDPASSTGSTMSTVAGTPTNNLTTKVLAAVNDEVRLPLIAGTALTATYSRDYTFRNHWDFKLHDTIPATGDCIVQIKDSRTLAVLQTTTLTLTATPTYYTVYYTPSDITTRFLVTVKKAAGTGNVVITDFISYGFASFSQVYEENHGIGVPGGGNDCVVENFLLEGVSGDGLYVNTSTIASGAQRFTARNVVIRNVGRQGIAPCGGRNHQFLNCTTIFGARHSVDFEPEISPEAIDGCVFENFWSIEPQIGPAFSSAQGWSRTRNVKVNGAHFFMNTGVGAVGGGYNGAHFSNVTIVRTDATSVDDDIYPSSINGRNIVLENWKTDEGIEVNATSSQVDDFGNTVSGGGWVLRNIAFMKHPHIGYINITSTGVHLENITADSANSAIDTTKSLGGIGLMPDTTYTNVNLALHRASLPNSWKGIATQAWFPGGLDVKNEPLSRVRALSGSTTKGNNLGRFQVPITAASTTATVTFPAKTAQNFTNFTLLATTGGSLSTSTTYYYRVAGRPRHGGPPLALAEKSLSTGVSGNAIAITGVTTYLTASGLYVDGMTIYRGVAPGVYTTRYDIVPTSDLNAWGITGTGANSFNVSVRDFGTTVTVASGSSNFYHGYTFPYSAQSGSFTPVDETGFEPDANYAVFIEPSWHTTWRISARRTNGFDVEFGVPVPTGTYTFSWMIARF